MQPYFLPYIGYWQLLSAVDRFVIYDNIKYTKKGWINRNRFLRNGNAAYFTLPLRQGLDSLDVADRSIADDFDPSAMLRPLESAYRNAPCFGDTFPLLETIVMAPTRNLFGFLLNSIEITADYLGIRTPIVVSSRIAIDHDLKSQDKVIALCRALGANEYFNPIGGRELYSPTAFAECGIELRFLQSRPADYPQFGEPFVPALSILDVLMFNSRTSVQRMLAEFDLV